MLLELTRQASVVERSGTGAGRLRSPGDLVARMRPRFAEAGITRLADITGLDNVGLPVWAAIRPNAPTLAVCQGKGETAAAAQASAVMEAVELAAAERAAGQRDASAAELTADGHVVDLLPALVRRGHAVPGEQARIGWLRGYDLLAEHPVWVPAGAVRIDATDPNRTYWQSSDGLGSGSLMIEAVLHGLFERIERDAGEFWHLRSDEEVALACVDPDTFHSPRPSALSAAIRRAGLHLRLFDITGDLGVPVYFATVSPKPDGGEVGWTHFDLASGMGCRLDPALAAVAAIAEALQSRLTTISGARDDYQPETYAVPIEPDTLIYPRARPLRRRPAGSPVAIDRALDLLMAKLRTAAIESVIVVPLHEDEDFAVAKVIVPDLELPPGARLTPHGRRLERVVSGLSS